MSEFFFRWSNPTSSMLHSPTFTSKHGDADSRCLAGCSMKMNFVRTTLMQEKNILTVYTSLVLMIEEIKYSIEKKKCCFQCHEGKDDILKLLYM